MVPCPRCQYENAPDARFCSNCGQALQPAQGGAAPAPPPYEPRYGPPYAAQGQYSMAMQKEPGIAAIIALVGGLFGLMGLGHIYVGLVARGLIIMVCGIALWALSIASFFLGIITIGGGLWVLGFVLVIISFALLIWQTYDAYRAAMDYNAALRATGRAPW